MVNSRYSVDWTDERIQSLKDMINEGIPDDLIARRFNTTNRAISAKRARIGMCAKPHLRNNFAWTEEREEELRKLVALKMPDRDIAERLGVTKNAIIGKKSRLGLSNKTRRVYNTRRPPKRVINQQVAPRSPERPTGPVSLSGGCFHPDHPESSPVDASGYHSRCRYPFGSAKTGDLTWCGEPAQANSSYCEEHHKLCHAPTRPTIKTAGITRWR